MYEISIQSGFSAAHAIVIAGVREPMHGHDWSVRITIAGPMLDADGLLIDFHALERSLDAILRPFHNANLNDTPPFDTLNPTAEHVAGHIAERLSATLPPSVRVASVAVDEAPGCTAIWHPDAS